MTDNGWGEYKKLVEYRMDKNDAQYAEILAALNRLQREVADMRASIKVHAAWWGILGSASVMLLYIVLPVLIGSCK